MVNYWLLHISKHQNFISIANWPGWTTFPRIPFSVFLVRWAQKNILVEYLEGEKSRRSHPVTHIHLSLDLSCHVSAAGPATSPTHSWFSSQPSRFLDQVCAWLKCRALAYAGPEPPRSGATRALTDVSPLLGAPVHACGFQFVVNIPRFSKPTFLYVGW